MKLFKANKFKSEAHSELLNNVSAHFNENVESEYKLNDLENKYEEFEATYLLVESKSSETDPDTVIFLAYAQNNIFYNFVPSAVRAIDKGLSVYIYISTNLGPKTSNLIYVMENLGANIIKEKNIKIKSITEIETSEYITIDYINKQIDLRVYLYDSESPEMSKPISAQDGNSLLAYVKYGLKNGYKVVIEDFNNIENIKYSQEGIRKEVKLELNQLLNENENFIIKCLPDEMIEDLAKETINNHKNTLRKIPEYEEYEHESSKSGLTKRNNSHEIMRDLEANKIIKAAGEGVKILVESENLINADILVIDEKEKTAILIEVKSFGDTSHYKALGQLQIYEQAALKFYKLKEVRKILLLKKGDEKYINEITKKAFEKHDIEIKTIDI